MANMVGFRNSRMHPREVVDIEFHPESVEPATLTAQSISTNSGSEHHDSQPQW